MSYSSGEDDEGGGGGGWDEEEDEGPTLSFEQLFSFQVSFGNMNPAKQPTPGNAYNIAARFASGLLKSKKKEEIGLIRGIFQLDLDSGRLSLLDKDRVALTETVDTLKGVTDGADSHRRTSSKKITIEFEDDQWEIQTQNNSEKKTLQFLVKCMMKGLSAKEAVNDGKERGLAGLDRSVLKYGSMSRKAKTAYKTDDRFLILIPGKLFIFKDKDINGKFVRYVTTLIGASVQVGKMKGGVGFLALHMKVIYGHLEFEVKVTGTKSLTLMPSSTDSLLSWVDSIKQSIELEDDKYVSDSGQSQSQIRRKDSDESKEKRRQRGRNQGRHNESDDDDDTDDRRYNIGRNRGGHNEPGDDEDAGDRRYNRVRNRRERNESDDDETGNRKGNKGKERIIEEGTRRGFNIGSVQEERDSPRSSFGSEPKINREDGRYEDPSTEDRRYYSNTSSGGGGVNNGNIGANNGYLGQNVVAQNEAGESGQYYGNDESTPAISGFGRGAKFPFIGGVNQAVPGYSGRGGFGQEPQLGRGRGFLGNVTGQGAILEVGEEAPQRGRGIQNIPFGRGRGGFGRAVSQLPATTTSDINPNFPNAPPSSYQSSPFGRGGVGMQPQGRGRAMASLYFGRGGAGRQGAGLNSDQQQYPQ